MKREVGLLDEHELEAMRREALEFLGIGLYRYRFDGTVVFIDAGAMRILGIEKRYADPDAVVGCNIGELIEYVGPKGLLRSKIRRQGKAHGLEYSFKTLDGEERCAMHDSYLVRDPGTGEELIQVIIKDISEQKRMEDALSRERERLAVTLRSIGDGVITTDTEGRITLVNKVGEELTGWSYEDARGRPLEEVFRIVSERTGEPCESPVDKVLASGKIVGLANDTVLLARDGTERTIADSGAPIRDARSRVIGVVLVFRDVTRQQQMERELQRMDKLESVGVLAGGLAHDFNNLLSTILGNVGLAQLWCGEHQYPVDLLVEVEKASLRAKDLTHQLLTFSRGGTPVRETTAVEGVVREAVAFALSGSNCGHELEFAVDLRPVDADVGQLGRVIHNLVINADQAMPEGGTITVRGANVTLGAEESSLAPGDYVRLDVIDEGEGIGEDALGRVFDPYYSTKEGGSGLGLAIAHSIVKHHEGLLSARSKPGRGATFTLFLPASVGTPPQVPASASGTFEGSGRVLVMDDEQSLREMMGNILSHLGYTPTFTESGDEALEVFRKAHDRNQPFHVVILDLTVPGGMGGAETAGRLREIDPNLKAIACSGYSSDPIMAGYRDHGFDAALPKPYTIAEFSRVLHRVLSG